MRYGRSVNSAQRIGLICKAIFEMNAGKGKPTGVPGSEKLFTR